MSQKITDLPLLPDGIISSDITIPVTKSENDPKTYKMSLSQIVPYLQTQGFGVGGGYQGFQGPPGATGATGAPGANGASVTYGMSLGFNPVNVFYYKNDNSTPYGVTSTTVNAFLQNLTPTNVNPVRFAVLRYDANGGFMDSTVYNATVSPYNSISYTASQLGSATSALVSATFLSGSNAYTAYGQILREVDGANGQPAFYGLLTNYSASLPADSSGNVTDYSNAQGVFNIYSGQNLIPAYNVTYSVLSQTNVTGTINSYGIYSVSNITAGATSGQLTLQGTYGSQSASAIFTVTKAKAGTSGTAKLLSIGLNKSVFVFSGNSPLNATDTVSATVLLDNIVPATSSTYVNWTASVYDSFNNATNVTSSLLTVPSNSAVKVLPVSVFTNNPTAISCGITASILDVSTVTYTNTQSVVKLVNGSSAIIGILTNDSATVNADSNGTVTSNVSAISGRFFVYSGATDVTSQSTGFGVYSITNANGSTLTFVASANDGSVKNIYVPTNIGGTNVVFTLSAVYNGTTVYKTFTVSKVIAGATGDTGAGPVYQGAYVSGVGGSPVAYYYVPGVRADIVLYPATGGSYYIANNAAKSGMTGWDVPGTSSDWATFGASFKSVATDLLLAQEATITQYLNLGGYTGTTLPTAAIRSYSTTPTIAAAKTGSGVGQVAMTGNGFYLGYPTGTGGYGGADAIFFVGDGTGGSSNYTFWNGQTLTMQGNISINPLGGNGIYSGKTSYSDNTAGWFLGLNSTTPVLNIGSSTNYIKWTGSELDIKGVVNVTGGNTALATDVSAIINGSAAGTFISGNQIASPYITGASGYIGGTFTVGSSTPQIVLDGSGKKIYVGGGSYYDSGTPFYTDSTGQFSLGNKLKFDTSGNLTLNGNVTAAGGTIGGWKINSGYITDNSGNVTLNSTSSYVGLGTTSYKGAGVWFGLNSGVYKFSLGTDLYYDGAGNLTIGGSLNGTTGTFSGTLNAVNGSFSGTITGSTGTVGGWSINSTNITGGNTTLGTDGSFTSTSSSWNNSSVVIGGSNTYPLQVTDSSSNVIAYISRITQGFSYSGSHYHPMIAGSYTIGQVYGQSIKVGSYGIIFDDSTYQKTAWAAQPVVVSSSPTDGQVLTYNGGNWVNASTGPAAYIGQPSNNQEVIFGTPTNGQVLTYNGSYWTNANSSGGGSTPTLDQVLTAGNTSNNAIELTDGTLSNLLILNNTGRVSASRDIQGAQFIITSSAGLKFADGTVQTTAAGAQGAQGSSGFSGFSGATGAQGFSGFSGAAGSQGTSGFSGFSGAQGSAGSSSLPQPLGTGDSPSFFALTVGGGALTSNGGLVANNIAGFNSDVYVQNGSTLHLSGPISSSSSASFSSSVAASSFSTPSSRKWKTNIKPITDALNTVTKLQGVTFDWNTKDLKDDIGLIAEDTNEVLPTIISKDDNNTIVGIDYSRLTALLIEAVKQLNEKIKVLETK